MPMAALVMLSAVIFIIGVANVLKVSRAKLKAQNLADASALYIASQVARSLNAAADRNESLNHFYANPNDPKAGTTGSNVCSSQGKNYPVGLGCFASRGANAYEFPTKTFAQTYAKLVQRINQIQTLFKNANNVLLGAPQTGALTQGSPQTLQANISRQIPGLTEPGVSVVLFNTASGFNSAKSEAERLKDNPQAPSRPLDAGRMKAVEFKFEPVRVTYKKALTEGGGTETKTLTELAGQQSPDIGFQVTDDSQPQDAFLVNNNRGGGAIVTVPVQLIGLGTTRVQATAMAVVINKSGSVGFDPQSGHAYPTFLVRLVQP